MGHLHWFSWSLIVLIVTAIYHIYLLCKNKSQNRKWFVLGAVLACFAMIPLITAYSQIYRDSMSSQAYGATGFGTCLFCFGMIVYTSGVFAIFYMPYRLVLSIGKRSPFIARTLKMFFISILLFYVLTLPVTVYYNAHRVYPSCVEARTYNTVILGMDYLYGMRTSSRKAYLHGVLSGICANK